MRYPVQSLAMAISLAASGSAQAAYYEEITVTHLPSQLAGACMDAAAGDADGDGDLDLALAMEFQTNVLLLNDGAARFSDASAQLPRTAHDSEDVAFADFDGDGDLDLALVSEDDRTDELYFNDGSGNFSDASTRLVTDDVSNALVVMDLDGDGRQDLLTGNIGNDLALINDGQGGFRNETARRWPQQGESRTQDLEAADVDGDRDLDVIVANEGQNQLYLNEDGYLRDVTATHLPLLEDETREIRAADVDGDRDLDLLVANVEFLLQQVPQDYLLLNDGTGHYTRAAPLAYPEDSRSNFTIQAVDLDRDGDMDALAPSTVFGDSTAEFIVLARDANGDNLVLRPSGLNMMDTDADGDTDAEISDAARTVTLINDGNGLVYPAGEAAWEASAPAQNIDLENNGTADLSVTRVPSALLANDSPAMLHTATLQLIDLGLDGSVDIMLPVATTLEKAGNYLVLLNDGRGQFAIASPGSVLPASADGNGFDIEVADFDGDGLSDLFLCNRASINEPGAAMQSGGLQRLLRGVKD